MSARAERLRRDLLEAGIARCVEVTESEWDDSMDLMLGEIPPDVWDRMRPVLHALRRAGRLESVGEGFRVLVGDLTLRVLVRRSNSRSAT